MKMFLIAAALALIAAPVAGASTSQSSRSKTAVEQQTMLKLAQSQDTKQRSDQYNKQYNKQDTTKRKSWGGG